MDILKMQKIIHEEFEAAELNILRRLQDEEKSIQSDTASRKPMPDNENYQKALSLYLEGEAHSAIAKKLGVSMAQVKKYWNWLVINGYLPTEDAELSEMEKRVAEFIFVKKMSLRETAQALDCSVSNVTYRRDSALRKGYKAGL